MHGQVISMTTTMFTKTCVLLLLADLALGMRIFLHPTQSSFSPSGQTVTPAQARAIVSHHLGLEDFDTVSDMRGLEWALNGGDFAGYGEWNGLMLTMSEESARDSLPPLFTPTFSLKTSTLANPDLSLVVDSYAQRAESVYGTVISEAPHAAATLPRLIDVFGAHPSDATDKFLSEMTQAVYVIESDEKDIFGALTLKGLDDLRNEFGHESDVYGMAIESTRALLESATAKDKLALALLTFPSSSNAKRQQQPPQSPLPPGSSASPQLPIGGVSTCFTSEEACGNATSSCSGHGACVSAQKAGRTCFVCACSATRDDDTGSLEEWAGEACERKDISSAFVLIAGTVIGSIIIIVSSISLLYTVGAQELPSTLVAGASGSSKRD